MWTILAITLSAQAGVGPGVTVRIAAPPPNLMPGVQTVSVSPFSGTNGEQIAMEIRAAIADPERIGKDAGALGQALLGDLTEVGAQFADAAAGGGILGDALGGAARVAGGALGEAVDRDPIVVEDGLRVDLFRLADENADIQIGGSVRVASTVRDYKMTRNKTDAKGNVIKDSAGKPVKEEVPCKERKATVEVSWSLEGAYSAQGTHLRDNSDSKCAEAISTLANEEALALPILSGWGPIVAEQILPSWHIVRLNLMRDRDLREELQLARTETLMPAICNLRGLVAFDEYYVPGIFNTGVLLEALGHLDAAKAEYQRAMAVKQEKTVSRALTRVEARQKAVVALTSTYGLEYRVGAPDFSSCPVLPDGRRVVLKKDTELFADASSTSPTTTLPKGMKVWVTTEDGVRASIATMDGKSGTVDAKAVK